MDISQLTQQELDELQSQLNERKEAARRKREEDIEAYKNMVEQFVTGTYKRMRDLSEEMRRAKDATFADAEALIRMRESLYNVKVDRHSNTFSTKYVSITVGSRTNDGWDSTVDAGIEKVKEYLAALAKDDDSAKLYDIVMRLLSKDKKGNLKAPAMLQLEQYASKFNDPLFSEGVEIIRNAYRPVESCQFVQVKYKDVKGVEHTLPLSLASMTKGKEPEAALDTDRSKEEASYD